MIKIIADSGCDFTEDMRNQNNFNIFQIPLNLQLGDKHYIDDENLNTDNFVKDMVSYKGKRKTSAPSPELYLNAYKGKESIFVITLSSHLSGSYNSAVLAKNMYTDEIGDKFIYIIDSLSASAGETAIAYKLNELIKNNFSDDEIVNEINKFVSNMNTYFILECYDNLVNTGRLNPYVAKLASLLSIVPICGAENGNTILKTKARGQKKSFLKLIELVKKEGKDFEEKILYITHVSCIKKANELKDEIKKSINFKDIVITKASGLCSTYADYKGLVIAF